MKDIWIICNVFRNIKKIKYPDFQAMTRIPMVISCLDLGILVTKSHDHSALRHRINYFSNYNMVYVDLIIL